MRDKKINKFVFTICIVGLLCHFLGVFLSEWREWIRLINGGCWSFLFGIYLAKITQPDMDKFVVIPDEDLAKRGNVFSYTVYSSNSDR